MSTQTPRQGTALCLSGGGYRAALFHLGVLRRLDELGVLARVDTISSVSGGSILSGFIAGRVPEWPTTGRLPGFADKVVPDVRAFTTQNIRTLWAGKRALPWNWTDSAVAVESLVSRYERDVVDMKLTDLPERPRYVFCATDLTFGINWVSERRRMGSYEPGYVMPPPWPVARAVAASSCFPPAFEPMEVGIEPERFHRGTMRTDDPDRSGLIRGMALSDGGVYDNLALEPVLKDHAVLLVSDGGATFDPKSAAGIFRPFEYLGRYMSVQGNQATSVRKRWLIDMFIRKEMSGAYLGIGSDVASFHPALPGYSARLVRKRIAEIRTDLDYFSDAEAAVLQNHGYLLADAAMQIHGEDAWRDPGPMPPPVVPFPEYMDEARVWSELEGSSKRKTLGRWSPAGGARDGVRGGLKRLRGLLPRR